MAGGGPSGGWLERAFAGGWATPCFPKARTGAACMPGWRRAREAPGGRRQRALPGCLWTRWGRGGSGAWAFGGPGAGEGSGGGSADQHRSSNIPRGRSWSRGEKGKTHVLSSSGAGTPGGADRKRIKPLPTGCSSSAGPPRRDPRTRAPVTYPPTAPISIPPTLPQQQAKETQSWASCALLPPPDAWGLGLVHS